MAEQVLMTVAEAAQTLRCSGRQVWRLIAAGQVVLGRKHGRKAVVLAESVYAACEVEAQAAPKPRVRRKQTREEFEAEIFAVTRRA